MALARVVGVEGSGPREAGATMAVSEDGEVAGSVSGGCVEGAVVTEALAALEAGAGARRCTFGYSDDEAFAVGLTCGGTVHLLVDPELPAVYDELRAAIEQSEPVALATVTEILAGWTADERADECSGPDLDGAKGEVDSTRLGATMLVREDGTCTGTLGESHLDEVVRRDATGALASGLSATRHYGPTGEARQGSVEVFIEVFARPPRLIIFGAVDFTAALARLGKVLGYRVTVCDARPVFATPARFPMADEVVVDRPERYLEKSGDRPDRPRRRLRAHPQLAVRCAGHRGRRIDQGRVPGRHGVEADARRSRGSPRAGRRERRGHKTSYGPDRP